jgi:putative nucleotidyltransferase with HDIG domain
VLPVKRRTGGRRVVGSYGGGLASLAHVGALVDWARDLAGSLLAEQLPRRWAHTQGVAEQAATLAPILGGDAELVRAAAWLHDIGYSPAVDRTGFHPLDGARYLRDVQRADDRLCRLVAHHSCASVEAEERGLSLDDFPPERGDLADALTYCDITTGPDGDTVSVDDRLREVQDRYGPEHVVSRFIRRATPEIEAAVERIGSRLNV